MCEWSVSPIKASLYRLQVYFSWFHMSSWCYHCATCLQDGEVVTICDAQTLLPNGYLVLALYQYYSECTNLVLSRPAHCCIHASHRPNNALGALLQYTRWCPQLWSVRRSVGQRQNSTSGYNVCDRHRPGSYFMVTIAHLLPLSYIYLVIYFWNSYN